MNQALAFGLLLAGGVTLEAGLTGKGLGAVLQGRAGSIPKTGSQLSVAGAGSAIANAAQVNQATGAIGGTGKAGLTSGQQTFATQLSARTGLSAGVIAAWLLAEESGGAAQSRQAANNNDWLNIGYTDTATFGAADSIWSSPITAANATADWLEGKGSIPGYGTASSGIRGILAAAGQSPGAQISAIQHSGWASSGYPDLANIYNEVA